MDTTSNAAVSSRARREAEAEQDAAAAQRLKRQVAEENRAVIALVPPLEFVPIVSHGWTFVNEANTTYSLNNSVVFCQQCTKTFPSKNRPELS